MEYTHNIYCDMFMTLSACNSHAGTAARNKCYIMLADVIQMLMCFNNWSSVSMRGSVKPTAPVNAGHPQRVQTPANEDAITAAVE
jgi:hypothetical protein